MPVTKQDLPKRKCPVCGTKFKPRTKWQKYDKTRCGKDAFDMRLQAKLKRLEELESKGMA